MSEALSLQRQSSRMGFTLIEVLVSVGILTFIIGIGITLFTSLTGQYDKASSVTNLQREGERMIEQISRTVRNSESVSGGGTSILLSIPDDADNLEYKANGQCTQVEFIQDGASLRKITLASSCLGTPSCPLPGCELNYPNWAQVTAVQFSVTQQANAPDEVGIAFSLQAATAEAGGASSIEFRKTVLTRNY